jgi:heme-degrading monooxygenase HmoA
VFARVITAKVAAAQFDAAVGMAQAQLQSAAPQPGFSGVYLLADREAGQLMTISLWDTYAHLQAVEARAGQTRRAVSSAMQVATPDVAVYEVAIQLPAV